MLKKVAFTAYKVENMERARRFYKELGLKEGFNYEDKYIEYDLSEGGALLLQVRKKLFRAGVEL